MSKAGLILRSVMALLAVLTVTACTPVYRYHGFVPTDQDLEEVQVGLDTRKTVASIIGKPGTFGLLAESGWYYVRSEFKHDSFRAPEEINREIVAVSFDEDGVVTNIERFGLERGQVVVLSRRVTESNIQGVSFLKQLFGGIGGSGSFANLFN